MTDGEDDDRAPGLDLDNTNKAQRLAVAAAIAPALRVGAAGAKARRVGRLDKDGNIVGWTTLAEVQAKLLEAHALEIAVDDGVVQTEKICARCGRPFKLARGARGQTLHNTRACPACQVLEARCHPERPAVTADGLCEPCYRRARAPRAKCHPKQPASTADGLCSACYIRERRARAKCHPKRPAATADGLCRSCYVRERAPRAKCHPTKPAHTADGLCRACYRRERAPRAKCHPTKAATTAEGLCSACYQRACRAAKATPDPNPKETK